MTTTTAAGRRLRVVPPLAGQLSLVLPGIPTAEQVAERGGGAGCRASHPVQPAVRRCRGGAG